MSQPKTVVVNHGGQLIKAHGVSIMKVPSVEVKEVQETEDIEDVMKELSDTEQGGTGEMQSGSSVSNGESRPSREDEELQEGTGQSECRIPIHEREMQSDSSVSNGESRPSRGDTELQERTGQSECRIPIHERNHREPDGRTGNNLDLRNLKCGQRFHGFDEKTGEHISGKIISRAGKVKGSNKYCYNVERDASGWRGWINLEKIKDLTFTSDDMPLIVLYNNQSIAKAKSDEIKNWIDNDVFEEVDDEGQPTISVRWVITEKVKDSRVVTKARLVARGFEENTTYMSKESPTCGTDVIRLTTAIAASKRWDCRSVDVKAAYLQGDEIKRDIFVRPPGEFDDGRIWRLKKTIYGLCDAAQAWYKKVKKELISLGVKVSPLDCSLFYWHVNKELQGIICVYVDDFLYCGTELFLDKIIQRLIRMFRIGSSSRVSFTYVGINFNSYMDGLTMDQDHYVASMDKIPLSTKREAEKDSDLTVEEKKAFRSLIGQLSWVSTHTRPDVAFETCALGGIYKTAKVTHVVKLNSLVDRLKNKPVHIYYPRLPTLERCILRCYTDASFGSLPRDGSQAGFIIYLENESGDMTCPVYWQSRRIERVVTSSMAAECYALTEGAQFALFLKKVLGQLVVGANIKIICMTDNLNLRNVLYAETKPRNRWFRMNISCLCEMMEYGELDEVVWVDSTKQLADPLTKGGVCRDKLIKSICKI